MPSIDRSRPAPSVQASACPSPLIQRPALSIEACPPGVVFTSERATPTARSATSVGGSKCPSPSVDDPERATPTADARSVTSVGGSECPPPSLDVRAGELDIIPVIPVIPAPSLEIDPLDDPTNYVDQAVFFDLLQDKGVPFRDDEKYMFESNPEKNKSRHIRLGNVLYPKVWVAASKLFKIYKPKRLALFPKMSPNGTNTVRFLGETILQMRFMKGRGDLYTAVAENVQMSLATDNSEYCELEEIFFLSQRLLLQTMLNKGARRWTISNEQPNLTASALSALSSSSKCASGFRIF